MSSRNTGALISQVFTLLPKQKELMDDASLRFGITLAQIAREAVNLWLLSKGYPKDQIPDAVYLPASNSNRRIPRLLDLPGMPPPKEAIPHLDPMAIGGVLSVRSDALGPAAPPPPPPMPGPLERHFFYYDREAQASVPISESELRKKACDGSWTVTGLPPIVLKGENEWQTVQHYLPDVTGFLSEGHQDGSRSNSGAATPTGTAA